jgi:putative membrane protein
MKLQRTGVLLGLLIFTLMQACESNKRAHNYNNKPLVDDKGLLFFTNATETSLTTVKASGLVIANSKNQEVVQFGKNMINNYTKLAADLKKLQADNFVTAEDSISTLHQQTIAGLEKKHAIIFDKAYMQEMVSEHQQQIELFNSASQDKNVNVADFAKEVLPALHARLDSAKAISSALK